MNRAGNGRSSARFRCLSLPSTSTSRRAPLELTFVPRGAEEPLMAFYSVTPLTPGGWLDLLDTAHLPHGMRRLPLRIGVNSSQREVETRCLPMLPVLAYLLGENGGSESGSVRAWRLAARLVEQVAGNGSTPPDLGRFSAAFPPLAHAALLETLDEPEPLTARTALDEFVGAALRALAGAVREPKMLSAAESHPDAIDL